MTHIDAHLSSLNFLFDTSCTDDEYNVNDVSKQDESFYDNLNTFNEMILILV